MPTKEVNRNVALMLIDELLNIIDSTQSFSEGEPSEIETKLFNLSHWFQSDF